MNDTHPAIEKIYTALTSQLSPEDRALMGCSMHDTAKEIAISQIALLGNTKPEMACELFVRFYREDFSDAVLEKILKRLREYHMHEKGFSPGSTMLR